MQRYHDAQRRFAGASAGPAGQTSSSPQTVAQRRQVVALAAHTEPASVFRGVHTSKSSYSIDYQSLHLDFRKVHFSLNVYMDFQTAPCTLFSTQAFDSVVRRGGPRGVSSRHIGDFAVPVSCRCV